MVEACFDFCKGKSIILISIMLVLAAFSVTADLTDATRYFSFDNDTLADSNTTFIDLSGNHNGSIINAIYGNEGVLEDAAYFDGNGDVINASGIGTTTEWSVSVWLYPGELNDKRHIVGLENGYMQIYTENSYVRLHDQNEAQYVQSDASLQTSQWFHFVFRCNGSTGDAEIWINGVLNASETNLNQCELSSNSFFTVGNENRYGTYPTQAQQGRIDETGYWERWITDSEISDLYNNSEAYNPYDIPLLITTNAPSEGQVFSNSTTSVYLNITTNENASCNYSNDNATWQMFSSQNGTLHEESIVVSKDNDYTYYFECFQYDDYSISDVDSVSFSVEDDPVAWMTWNKSIGTAASTDCCMTHYKNQSYISCPTSSGIDTFNESGHLLSTIAGGEDTKNQCFHGDFDNDGDEDMIYRYGTQGSDYLRVVQVGDWSEVWEKQDNVSRNQQWALEDIDNDGATELLGIGSYGLGIRDAATGTLEYSYRVTICWGGFALGNIDNDDYIEIVIGSEWGNNYGNENRTIALQWNGSHLTEEWYHQYDGADAGSDTPVMYDEDNDGIVDYIIKQNWRLATGGNTSQNHVVVHNANDGSVKCQANYSGGQGIAVADIVGDSKKEFVVKTSEMYGSTPSRLFIGNISDCSYISNISLEGFGRWNGGSIFVANVDDDPATNEILLGTGNNTAGTGHLWIFDNQGNRLFNETFLDSRGVQTPIVADMDQDGYNEIYVTTNNGEYIRYYDTIGQGYNPKYLGRDTPQYDTYYRQRFNPYIYPVHFYNVTTIVENKHNLRYSDNPVYYAPIFIESNIFDYNATTTQTTNGTLINMSAGTGLFNFSVGMPKNDTYYSLLVDDSFTELLDPDILGFVHFSYSDWSSHVIEIVEGNATPETYLNVDFINQGYANNTTIINDSLPYILNLEFFGNSSNEMVDCFLYENSTQINNTLFNFSSAELFNFSKVFNESVNDTYWYSITCNDTDNNETSLNKYLNLDIYNYSAPANETETNETGTTADAVGIDFPENPLNISELVSFRPANVQESMFLILLFLIVCAAFVFAATQKMRAYWYIASLCAIIFGIVLFNYSWAFGLIFALGGGAISIMKSM